MRRRITRHTPVVGIRSASAVETKKPGKGGVSGLLREDAPEANEHDERKALESLLDRLFGDRSEEPA